MEHHAIRRPAVVVVLAAFAACMICSSVPAESRVYTLKHIDACEASARLEALVKMKLLGGEPSEAGQAVSFTESTARELRAEGSLAELDWIGKWLDRLDVGPQTLSFTYYLVDGFDEKDCPPLTMTKKEYDDWLTGIKTKYPTVTVASATVISAAGEASKVELKSESGNNLDLRAVVTPIEQGFRCTAGFRYGSPGPPPAATSLSFEALVHEGLVHSAGGTLRTGTAKPSSSVHLISVERF